MAFKEIEMYSRVGMKNVLKSEKEKRIKNERGKNLEE